MNQHDIIDSHVNNNKERSKCKAILWIELTSLRGTSFNCDKKLIMRNDSVVTWTFHPKKWMCKSNQTININEWIWFWALFNWIFLAIFPINESHLPFMKLIMLAIAGGDASFHKVNIIKKDSKVQQCDHKNLEVYWRFRSTI